VNNFLGVGVVYGAEVQWVRVLAVIRVWAIVHERLLKTNFSAETLVVANRPWIAVHFVHVFWWNTDQAALFDNLGIFPHDCLHNLQVFHGDLGQSQQGIIKRIEASL
jgi:hypothetical protein